MPENLIENESATDCMESSLLLPLRYFVSTSSFGWPEYNTLGDSLSYNTVVIAVLLRETILDRVLYNSFNRFGSAILCLH